MMTYCITDHCIDAKCEPLEEQLQKEVVTLIVYIKYGWAPNVSVLGHEVGGTNQAYLCRSVAPTVEGKRHRFLLFARHGHDHIVICGGGGDEFDEEQPGG